MKRIDTSAEDDLKIGQTPHQRTIYLLAGNGGGSTENRTTLKWQIFGNYDGGRLENRETVTKELEKHAAHENFWYWEGLQSKGASYSRY